MNQEEIDAVLAEHAKYLDDGSGKLADFRGADLSDANLLRADLRYADLQEANLHYAVLSRADLRCADLRFADLSKAYLLEANLQYADLSYADLDQADLSHAELCGAKLRAASLRDTILFNANLYEANLYDADLRGADLCGTIFKEADLSQTCLSPHLLEMQRRFCKACPPTKHGGRIVYRSVVSMHVGNQEYIPGRTYVAPVLSFSSETDCHPGIYAASLEWMIEEYGDIPLVRCYVRDGEWVISAKGAIRCSRIRVLAWA